MYVLKYCVIYMILNELIKYIKIVWNDINNFLKFSIKVLVYNWLIVVNVI